MSEPAEQDGRIPIVVGATGHRDLLPQDIDELSERVSALLEAFRKQFPSSPFVLLTSLAEGADQLIASQALRCGYRLIAVLPFERLRYIEDFQTSESRARFDALLSQASAIVELPPNSTSNRSGSFLERPYAYARAAAYLVQHSSLFVALWDGNDSQRAGGTAQTIAYRLQGVPPELDDDWDPMQYKEKSVIYAIRTRRRSHTVSLSEPFQQSLLCSTGAAFQPSDLSALRAIDSFNAEWLSAGPGSISVRNFLADDGDGSKLREHVPESLLIEKRFQAADLMAVNEQQESNRTLLFILLLGFTSAVGVNQLQKMPSALLFSLCAAAIALAHLLYYRRIVRGRVQTKHQDYRGIAEALRVQFFWSLLGITDRAAQRFLRSTGDEGAWIRTAVRFATAELPLRNGGEREPSFRAAEKYWIQDQRSYFERSFRQQLSKNMAISSLKFSLLLFAGLFKLLPDTVRWILSDPTTRTAWFLAGQGVIALSLVGFHIWMRAKELGAQKTAFDLLDGAQGERRRHHVGFWSRPVGLLILVAVAVSTACGFGYSIVSFEAVSIWQAGRICELVFLTVASAAAMLHLYGYLAAYGDHLRQYGRMFSLFAHAEMLFREALSAGRLAEAKTIARTLGREALHEASDWLRLHRSRPIEVPRP